MSNTQLAERPQTDLRVMIQSDKIREQLAMALPKYYTPEQFILIVRTAINRTPKLAECDPTSFITSMITAAQMGIAPDGRNGHLIPRWNSKNNRMECTFQADYKGLVGLVRKSEDVADIYADVVCENDVFQLTKGLHRDIRHEVDIKKPRGPIVGVYAVIVYKDGSNSWDFLSREDVENVRARSDSWKSHVAKGYDSPWKTDEGEMFKKTAIKRLLKLADLSQETAERIAVDNSLDVTPEARVTEVKTAQIPETAPQPSLESPKTQQPEPQRELVEEQPEPEKPKADVKPTAPAKLTKAKPEETKPDPKVIPMDPRADLIDKTREALAKDGYTEAQLIRVMVSNEWGNWKDLKAEGSTVETFDRDSLVTLFEDGNWEAVTAEIRALKPE
jgi:recombination protein RecT